MADSKSIEATIAESSVSHLVENWHMHAKSGFPQQYIDTIIDSVVRRDEEVRNRFLAIFALGEVTDLNFRWTPAKEILRLEDKTMGPGSVTATLQARLNDPELTEYVFTHFSFSPDSTDFIKPVIGFSAGIERYASTIARTEALLGAYSFRSLDNLGNLDEVLPADLAAIGRAESTLELIERSLV